MTSGEEYTYGYIIVVAYSVCFDGDDGVYECENHIYAPTLREAAKIAIMLSDMGQAVEKITAVYEPCDIDDL